MHAMAIQMLQMFEEGSDGEGKRWGHWKGFASDDDDSELDSDEAFW